MPDDPDYNMHDLQKDMRYVKMKMSKMDITIHGPDDSHEPIGLKHEVGRNSHFRENTSRILWLFLTAIIGIIVTLILNGTT